MQKGGEREAAVHALRRGKWWRGRRKGGGGANLLASGYVAALPVPLRLAGACMGLSGGFE